MTGAAGVDLAARMGRARGETLALIDLIEATDLNRSLHPDFSPIRWHLGHIAAFEESWIAGRAGGLGPVRPDYEPLFDPTKNPKAARVHLPDKPAILDYAAAVRESTGRILAGSSPDHDDPLLRDGYVGEMVYEHECQHQEIMTFLLQMIPPGQKRRPEGWRPAPEGDEPDGGLVAIPAGSFTMGDPGGGFAYDNERDPHAVDLPAYRIGRSPVTEPAFADFLDSGGYADERLWSPGGWRWVAENAVTAPRDWVATPDGLAVRTMFADRPPAPGVPVIGVSAYEAEAFGRWAGLRLPTEAEWERAAAWDDAGRVARRYPWGGELPTADLANLDGHAWGTRPVSDAGRSASGCDDMVGQVWEWMSTAFGPYPGFRAFPYDGYSAAWFDGEHRVLRGGSWATRGPLGRCSFRNWYHPFVRQLFSGFRLAGDN